MNNVDVFTNDMPVIKRAKKMAVEHELLRGHAECFDRGYRAALVDLIRTYDPEWAKAFEAYVAKVSDELAETVRREMLS